MKTLLILAFITATLTHSAIADGLGYVPNDTPHTVLTRQTGQLVELRLKSGDKLSGKVAAVSDQSVHLTSLTGQEFFEAVIVLDDISAVIVRAAAAKK